MTKSETSYRIVVHARDSNGFPVDLDPKNGTKSTTLDDKIRTEKPYESMAIYAEA